MQHSKKCRKCNELKAFNGFYIKKTSKDGISNICKICHCKETNEWHKENRDSARKSWKKHYENNKVKIKEKNNIWAKNNPDKIKNKNIKRMYKITIAVYNVLLSLQDNRCAICKRYRDEFKKDFAVDHNHITGQVRGLLCSSCNQGIGYLKADYGTDLLEKAILYVKENK